MFPNGARVSDPVVIQRQNEIRQQIQIKLQSRAASASGDEDSKDAKSNANGKRPRVAAAGGSTAAGDSQAAKNNKRARQDLYSDFLLEADSSGDDDAGDGAVAGSDLVVADQSCSEDHSEDGVVEDPVNAAEADSDSEAGSDQDRKTASRPARISSAKKRKASVQKDDDDLVGVDEGKHDDAAQAQDAFLMDDGSDDEPNAASVPVSAGRKESKVNGHSAKKQRTGTAAPTAAVKPKPKVTSGPSVVANAKTAGASQQAGKNRKHR